MDMMQGQIRDVFAAVLSKGAKALERTAGELEQAASALRRDRPRQREDTERPSSEQPRREPDRMIRSAPLRAVPTTPVDEDDQASSWTPPEQPPQMPERERPGDVDAQVTTSTEVAGAPDEDANARVAAIAAGTVNQARARLDELTPAELRRLREIEAADRNRVTLLAAIDGALED